MEAVKTGVGRSVRALETLLWPFVAIRDGASLLLGKTLHSLQAPEKHLRPDSEILFMQQGDNYTY